jgi:small subunit ribosomal protein S14
MAKKSKIAKTKRLAARMEVLKGQTERKENRVSTRVNNRCKICGRPRGYIRFFGVCRLCFRELALKGELAGVTKASK